MKTGIFSILGILLLLGIWLFYRAYNSPVVNHLIMFGDYNKLFKQSLGSFEFGTENFTEDFEIKLPRSNIYELALRPLEGVFPAKIKFDGELRLEIFSQDKLVATYEITKFKAGIHAKKPQTGYDTFVFCSFPLKKQNVKLRLTVIRPDSTLVEVPTNLIFRVSSTP
jgi:hypothetical protein